MGLPDFVGAGRVVDEIKDGFKEGTIFGLIVVEERVCRDEGSRVEEELGNKMRELLYNDVET